MSVAEVKFTKRICLIGAPNSGKTTLYNWLTNSRFKTVNYPGATVEVAEGMTAEKWGASLFVCDHPGTYSLFPKSFDEKVAVDSLFEHPRYGSADLVLAVVDANQLARHLYLVRQVIEAGFPVVVAITNIDLLKEKSFSIDVEVLEQKLGAGIVLVNGQTGEGVRELVRKLALALPAEKSPVHRAQNWNREKCEQTYGELTRLAHQTLVDETVAAQVKRSALERTRKIDRVLLHPVGGVFIFVVFMAALFTSIFWAAAPAMDWIDAGFSFLAEQVQANIKNPLLADFLANGVVAGVGAVLIFLPQIVILFLGISYFEDSGYLARAASLIDRPLSKIGMNGRSFVPLLSGFACAIPAMMAARTISSRKERWLTLFVVPLMSCSARLPVYALLLAFIFRESPAWMAGLALTALYFLAAFVGALVSWVAARFLKFTEGSFFLMELPVYRRPILRNVLKAVGLRARSYVLKAGPIIFVLALGIWAACTFPHYEMEDASERLTHSYAAQAGKFLEPVMEPMGVDWRVGIGLIAAFAAREVFVSSMAVVFHITDEDEDSMQAGLLKQMQEATHTDGSPLFTIASVLGLLLFFMIALQCMATFGVARREFGSWKAAIVQLILFNLLAYAAAVSVVKSFQFFGIS